MATDLAQQFCALRDTYIEKQFGRLNEMQRQAVFTTDGPLLILAGAGSGKTTVLVNRIANLIRFGSAHGSKWTPREVTEEDVKALRTAIMTGTDAPVWLDGMLRQNAVRSWNVMAITFTNKAAGELKERLRRMLGGEEGDEVFASTFHSACVRILRRWAEEIGYPRSFTIYDTDDAQRVMKTVYKELSVDDKFFPIKSAINQMSRWKDQLISPEEALRTPARDTKGALAAKVYAAYERKLKEAGAFDFDDLIYQTVILLSEHEDVREFYQNKYKYLLVDEYQDTSVAQFRLVSLLTGPEKNICVVGDDDQSIYRFRGATIENILNFECIYKDTKTIRLEQNYRSTSNILNAANCVIQHNTERKGKTLWTKNGEGDKVQVYTAENEQDEASHIADVIGQHLREGGHLADHAILYRMNAQSAPIESYFTRAGIPHKIVGGQRFNDRKEVKDIHSYMSIVANPRDDVRLRRIINEPTAAALAYGLDNGRTQTVMVYDLGGGTFDVSLIRIGDGIVQVLSTCGDNFLGGDDFDERIVNWLADRCRAEHGVDLTNDRVAMQRLREEAEKAKKELSSAKQTDINLPFLTMAADGALHLQTTLTRAKFEELCADLIERTALPVRNALSDARLSASDLDQVLLVGGSTRIPAVQAKVVRMTGLEPSKSLNPDECVALGAAVQAGRLGGEMLSGPGEDLLLMDVTPLTLSIETVGGVATHLIERNSTIPTRFSKVFTTAAPFQNTVQIKVLQGEREFARDNKLLGTFTLRGIKRAWAGVPKIEVTFDIDANGIVKVKARDMDTGKQQSITISGTSNLTEDEIKRAKENAAAFAGQDKERKAALEALNAGEAALYRVNAALGSKAGKALDRETRTKIKEAERTLERVLKHKKADKLTPVDVNVINTAREALSAVAAPLVARWESEKA